MLDELLTTKADATGTAVAAFHENLALVEKFHLGSTLLKRKRGTAVSPFPFLISQ
jgi:hypothetical protein